MYIKKPSSFYFLNGLQEHDNVTLRIAEYRGNKQLPLLRKNLQACGATLSNNEENTANCAEYETCLLSISFNLLANELNDITKFFCFVHKRLK